MISIHSAKDGVTSVRMVCYSGRFQRISATASASCAAGTRTRFRRFAPRIMRSAPFAPGVIERGELRRTGAPVAVCLPGHDMEIEVQRFLCAVDALVLGRNPLGMLKSLPCAWRTVRKDGPLWLPHDARAHACDTDGTTPRRPRHCLSRIRTTTSAAFPSRPARCRRICN